MTCLNVLDVSYIGTLITDALANRPDTVKYRTPRTTKQTHIALPSQDIRQCARVLCFVLLLVGFLQLFFTLFQSNAGNLENDRHSLVVFLFLGGGVVFWRCSFFEECGNLVFSGSSLAQSQGDLFWFFRGAPK